MSEPRVIRYLFATLKNGDIPAVRLTSSFSDQGKALRGVDDEIEGRLFQSLFTLYDSLLKLICMSTGLTRECKQCDFF